MILMQPLYPHLINSEALIKKYILPIRTERHDMVSCYFYASYSKKVELLRSMSYDAMTAHTAIVFTRYMMLSLENRESNDNRSLSELFLYLEFGLGKDSLNGTCIESSILVSFQPMSLLA